MWEGKVFAAADADAAEADTVTDTAETDWKHKVTQKRACCNLWCNFDAVIVIWMDKYHQHETKVMLQSMKSDTVPAN